MGASTLLVYSFNYDTQGIGKYLTNITMAGFILSEILASLLRRKIRIYPTVAIFTLFIGFCFFSILWSASLSNSWSRVLSLSLMLAYYLALTNFVLAYIGSRARLYLFAKVLVISSLFAAVYLLLTSDWQSGTRINGVIGDSNQASAYLAYAIPVALYCESKKLLPKLLIVVDVIAIIVAIGVMGSRTGIIVALFGIILYWIICSIQKGIISLRLITTTLLIIMAVVIICNFIMTNKVAYDIIGRRFESLFDILSGGVSKINEGSYYERQALYDLAIELFTSHPVIGVGIDAYSSFAAISIRNTFSHNDYLQLLSCVGIVGFSLYYAQHVYLMKRFRYLEKMEFAVCLTLFVMLLVFHMTVVFYYQKLEFVFLAFLSCMVCLARNQKNIV